MRVSRTTAHSLTRREGFTIVELLIVVVVIAILAAITIVAYNGISQRSKESAAASATKQAATKIAAHATINGDTYPDTLSQAGLREDGSTTYQYRYDNGARTFCVTALTNGISYYASSDQMSPRSGACPGHGANGVVPITNMAHDPRASSIASGVGIIGWRSNRWFGPVPSTGSYTTISGASDGPVGISTYLRKAWSSASGSGDLGFGIAPAAGTASETTGAVIQPNTTYAFSAYLRSNTTYNNGAQIQIWWHDAAGVFISTESSTRVTLPANTWVRLSLTATSPPNAATIGIVADLDGQIPPSTMVLDGTGFMMTATSNVPAYADGTSPGWAWNGAAHNSTSSGPPL